MPVYVALCSPSSKPTQELWLVVQNSFKKINSNYLLVKRGNRNLKKFLSQAVACHPVRVCEDDM